MANPLKGRWGNRTINDFLFQLGADFVSQLRDIMGTDVSRAELAAKLRVSKGRVSQILNNPGNLTMKNAVQYSSALGRKVAMVVYDDNDPTNENGPILPQIFTECWNRQGKPRDFFELNRPIHRQTFSFWAEKPREALTLRKMFVPEPYTAETAFNATPITSR